jgi:hypothetical protein
MGRLGASLFLGDLASSPFHRTPLAVAVDRQFHWRRPGRSVQSPPLLMSARTRTQLAMPLG